MRKVVRRCGLIGLAVLMLVSLAWAQAGEDPFTGMASMKLDLAEEGFSIEEHGARLILYWDAHFYFVQPGKDQVNLAVGIRFTNPDPWLPTTTTYTMSPVTREGVNVLYQKLVVASTEIPPSWAGKQHIASKAALFDKEQVITVTVTLKPRAGSATGSPLEKREYRFSPLGYLLMRAAKQGSVRDVELLVSRGADVNAADVHGITVLMMAAGSGRPDVVRTLLDNGANAQTRSRGSGFIRSANGSRLPGGNTALHAACYAGRPEIVGMLLAREADVRVKSGDGWTPVMAAAFRGDPRVLQLILQAGGDVRGITDTGYSAAALALINGNGACYRMLVGRGCTVRVPWKKDDV